MTELEGKFVVAHDRENPGNYTVMLTGVYTEDQANEIAAKVNYLISEQE